MDSGRVLYLKVWYSVSGHNVVTTDIPVFVTFGWS